MEAVEIISMLKKANSVVDVFGNFENWQNIYKSFSKKIHPDICSEKWSTEAFAKLNEYKEQIEKGKKFNDDAGTIYYYPMSVAFTGDATLTVTSFTNYKTLMDFKDKSSVHFKKYIPETGRFLSANETIYTFFRRAVPLASLGILKQEYVNFILSRMIEFTGWINQCGYCHAGINPDSVWVIPEDHGMQCVSFYHMEKLGTRLKTISGKYSQLYPSEVFSNKMGTSNVDLELAKRTAIWLLGDKSGTGNVLRKTHNTDFLNFVQKTHYDPIECYTEYRDMLKKNFDIKQFHILNI